MRKFKALIVVLLFSSKIYADDFKVTVKGFLKYYDTENKTDQVLSGIEIQVWDSDVPDASTIIDDFMGRGFTNAAGYFEITCTGGDPFHYSYSRPDVYLRVVLRNNTGLVRLTDELNYTQSYVIGLHDHDNVEGMVDFGTFIINSGAPDRYGTKMMVFQGASKVWQEFVDNAGLPPSGYYDIEYWSAIYHGTPWTNLNTTHWPIGYPINWLSTSRHEFGHAMRHSYDGDQAHWDWDNTRFLYARVHKCWEAAWGSTVAVRRGFAFNEGWAQYWSERCNCIWDQGDPTNMECEGNIAKALCELSELLPNKKWDMIKVLKANPGSIHSYEDFLFKATLLFPSLLQAVRQPIKGSDVPLVSPLSSDFQKEIISKNIALEIAYRDSMLLLAKAARRNADIGNVNCKAGICEELFQRIIRPHILNAEIEISNLIISKLKKNLEVSADEMFKDSTYSKWNNRTKADYQKKLFQIIYTNLNKSQGAIDKLMRLSTPSKEFNTYAMELKKKIKLLKADQDFRNIPDNLNPFLAYEDQFKKYDSPDPSQILPFDVIADKYDVNGYPLNPKWGLYVKHGQDTLLNHLLSGPTVQDNPKSWLENKAPCPCTHVKVTTASGGPVLGSSCGPHVNFTSICYTGILNWHTKAPAEGETCRSAGFSSDDDYNLTIVKTDAKYINTTTSEKNILIEFDSDETIDHFKTKWWSDLHNAVDNVSVCDNEIGKNPAAKNLLKDKKALVIGLLGLDCAGKGWDWDHHCGVELHPAFVMAINIEEKTKENRWAFFARNLGNEGICAPGNNSEKPKLYGHLDGRGYLYKVIIPGPKPNENFDFDPKYYTASIKNLHVNYWNKDHSEDVSTNSNRFETNFLQGKGMELTFILPPPERMTEGDYVIEGEITLDWKLDWAKIIGNIRFLPEEKLKIKINEVGATLVILNNNDDEVSITQAFIEKSSNSNLVRDIREYCKGKIIKPHSILEVPIKRNISYKEPFTVRASFIFNNEKRFKKSINIVINSKN